MTQEQDRLLRSVHEALLGNEFGQTGLVKRMASVEKKVNEHHPVILRVMDQEADKKDDRKKLRVALISAIAVSVLSTATSIILTITHLK